MLYIQVRALNLSVCARAVDNRAEVSVTHCLCVYVNYTYVCMRISYKIRSVVCTHIVTISFNLKKLSYPMN